MTLARVRVSKASQKSDSASAKGAALDFGSASQYITRLKASNIAELHGFYISDLEEATTQCGADAVAKQLKGLVKAVCIVIHLWRLLTKVQASPLLVFTNATTAFGVNEYVQQNTHGLVMDHPTMDSTGEYRLLPREEVTKAMSAAKAQMQKRVDFVLLAHECVPQELLKGGQVTRFVKFCQSSKIVPTLCVDCTHTRAELVQPVNPSPSGPLAVLASKHVEDFQEAFRKLKNRKDDNNNGKFDKTAMLAEVQALAQRLGFDLTVTSLQTSLETLLAQYGTFRESGVLFTSVLM